MMDWDDSILYMPTVIHTEKLVDGEWIKHDVSTADFRDIRKKIVEYYNTGVGEYKYPNDNPDNAYLEFRDFGERGDDAFYLDAIDSIKNKKFAPAWIDLINCIINGNLFMIITARGHEPKSIRKVIEYIIYSYIDGDQYDNMIANLKSFNIKFDNLIIDDDDFLIGNYLDLCEFIGINSDYFKKLFDVDGQAINPETFKSLAIEYFVNKIYKYGENHNISIGFSDDDTSTINHVNSLIKNELSLKFPMDYYIYNTKDGREKIKV